MSTPTKMRKYCYKKSEHLKKERDFTCALKNGIRYSDSVMTVYSMPNSLDYNRLGIIVAKKRVKKASSRNCLKRLVREAFRLNKSNLPKGFDIIVNIKQTESVELKDIAKSLLSLLVRT